MARNNSAGAGATTAAIMTGLVFVVLMAATVGAIVAAAYNTQMDESRKLDVGMLAAAFASAAVFKFVVYAIIGAVFGSISALTGQDTDWRTTGDWRKHAMEI